MQGRRRILFIHYRLIMEWLFPRLTSTKWFLATSCCTSGHIHLETVLWIWPTWDGSLGLCSTRGWDFWRWSWREETRGGKCESIKIPRRNLTYILKLTRRPSLLTHQGHIAIEELSTLRTGLVTVAETWIDASKNTCETDNKNRTKNNLSHFSHFTEQLVCVK
jgi:hypothetical protein